MMLKLIFFKNPIQRQHKFKNWVRKVRAVEGKLKRAENLNFSIHLLNYIG